MRRSLPSGMEPKIVLDTNVLVSALISRSYPYKIIYECVFEQKVLAYLSDAIFAEYEAVLARPKFAKFPNFKANAQSMLSDLEEVAGFYEPTFRLKIIKDEADNRFLELALVAQAEFPVTGNTNHFDFSEYQGVKIVSSRFFYENYCQ